AKTKVFDENLNEYEKWFIINEFVYKSELQAVQKAIPENKKGIEIGIGSGLFAKPLGIVEGIEPSSKMRKKARERNLKVINAVAEDLPYPDASRDFALMVTTICFVDDIYRTFQEAHRILKQNGHLIIGFVDKKSPIGKFYLEHKNESLFYQDANFFGTKEVYELLEKTGFTIKKTYQTVFGKLNEINQVQETLTGYGKGSFVVIKSKKVSA
ncbi:MAG TPA: class I SAM-dependent methyltransferase, partial [Candidatus Cloacimonetes bacterium]|nr:class I SAM-dependent methyltransferase [Candidatus Cloacimonadota bacterium]